MKRFINSNSMRVAFCTAMVALTSGPVFAQDLGNAVLRESTSALRNLVNNVVSLLQVVLGLGALVTLAIVIFNVFKGEREAATKIAWWVAGLTIGFALLTVVKNLIIQAV